MRRSVHSNQNEVSSSVVLLMRDPPCRDLNFACDFPGACHSLFEAEKQHFKFTEKILDSVGSELASRHICLI